MLLARTAKLDPQPFRNQAHVEALHSIRKEAHASIPDTCYARGAFAGPQSPDILGLGAFGLAWHAAT